MYDLDGLGGAPKLYAVAKDRPMIIMEYVDGLTVEKLVYNSDKKQKQLLISVMRKTVDRVCELHEAGYTHGDIHEGNILVCKTTQSEADVRLIDFGLCSQMPENELKYQKIIGDINDIMILLRTVGLLDGDEVKAMAFLVFRYVTDQNVEHKKGQSEYLPIHLVRDLLRNPTFPANITKWFPILQNRSKAFREWRLYPDGR